MRYEAGVVDAGNLGMFFEILCDGDRVFALTLYSQCKSLDAAAEEECRFGIHRAAEINHHVQDFVDPRFASGDGAGDDIGMAGESLGGAVDDHVEAERERLLQDRCCKSVVDDGDEIVFFGEGDGLLEIDEAHGRVGRRLDVEDFGERGQQAVEAIQVGFDLADGDAEAGENVAHEPVRAAVELRGGDDFVAGFEGGEQRVRDRGHAGGSYDGGFGALERGDFAFGDGERRVAVARVDVGFALAFGPAFHFGG